MNMQLDEHSAESNLVVTWSWSTASVDYGEASVPANYLVGLFIRNADATQWSALAVGSPIATPGTWAQRVLSFRDEHPGGGLQQPGSRIFPGGQWCVTFGAATTRETGGEFMQAPGALESCVSVPTRTNSRKPSTVSSNQQISGKLQGIATILSETP
jgi:hypothetical protein